MGLGAFDEYDEIRLSIFFFFFVLRERTIEGCWNAPFLTDLRNFEIEILSAALHNNG